MACGCGGRRASDETPPCGVILETLQPNPLIGWVKAQPSSPRLPRPPPQGLPWIPTIQCRDAMFSANTLFHRVRPETLIPTCHIIASLRNGVPCRCDCPPGCCRGKLQQFYDWRS